ncbi:hypothetical protein BU17DRAFT_68615 [Hysterangium stoloniferum]|nr:hypothetical protein BU17DRAFT_68615 [Hysterangium stoloniferum]
MFSSKFAIVVATLFASVLAAPAPDAGAKPFTLKNGQDAIALNQDNVRLMDPWSLSFLTLNISCLTLPLVNKPGTSITCDTAADRDARVAATGATHPGQAAPAPAPATAPPPADKQVLSDDKTSFTLSNGKATQALNLRSVSTANSSSPDVCWWLASITCVDNAQAVAHIAATGAGSSLIGN